MYYENKFITISIILYIQRNESKKLPSSFFEKKWTKETSEILGIGFSSNIQELVILVLLKGRTLN